MIKDAVVSSPNRLDIYFSVTEGLKKYFAPELHFFAEFSCEITDVPKSVLVIPLLGNILQFSWLVDCTVWVKEIDEVFYEQIPKIKRAFTEMYPQMRMGGTLIPATLVRNAYEAEKNAVQLFTGGVDAMTTFFRIQNQNPILLNTNGWFKENICEDKVFSADKLAIDRFAEQYGVVAEYVRSNFATFIKGAVIDKEFGKKAKNNWWHGFQHSIAFLTCAMVVGYHYRVKHIFIGSSLTFGQTIVTVSDPRVDNEIKCSEISTIHDGYELSRTEKIGYIIKKQQEQGKTVPLRVCSFKEKNCCLCEKCFRTMLAIEAEGGDVAQFGFPLSETVLESLKKFLRDNVNEVYPSKIQHWNAIIERMKENQSMIPHKEVLEFLENYNFKAEKRRFLYHYYTKNFFKILKRKVRQ